LYLKISRHQLEIWWSQIEFTGDASIIDAMKFSNTIQLSMHNTKLKRWQKRTQPKNKIKKIITREWTQEIVNYTKNWKIINCHLRKWYYASSNIPKLLKQCYLALRLKSSLQNLHGRHHELLYLYIISLSQMTINYFSIFRIVYYFLGSLPCYYFFKNINPIEMPWNFQIQYSYLLNICNMLCH
jgi:hypothetical protein